MEIIEGKKSGDTDISLYDDSYKISDRFPEIVLKVGQGKIVKLVINIENTIINVIPSKIKV